MALQPASGAKDLNPKQVETNHLLSKKLAEVYRLWGYEEVSPPRVERLATLMAGGAIENAEIVKLVADEPLGLRPEMTASIARAACTRFAQRPRPLRLWASGTVYQNRESIEKGVSIEESLQCGVELFGIKGISGEMELLSLLLDSMEKLKLNSQYEPRLLIGHTSLMELILHPLREACRAKVRNHLVNYDRLSLEKEEIEKELKARLIKLQECRGYPSDVLRELESNLGKSNELNNLKRLFSMIEPIAKKHEIELQLDPTFQPHFELYTGINFQLICKGSSAPVVIARGGRYDGLVKHFAHREGDETGLGFSFEIDKIRELLIESKLTELSTEKILITYSNRKRLEDALKRQSYWHNKGQVAEVELEPFNTEQEAILVSKQRACSQMEWLDD
ncbi:ATP phosphoribosyltransferase regulatory subunit [Prochlorococcus sp. MIT 1307]|uniref:ATP phosphoribosyltransferase regulatory subunit n=1 Tax=Prochlorococcus sp. MIT 1307 TaxID=3096219 RepID=UPI002A74C9DF|nr:ATP phosphoribosyltransferase regulatory subunit [Prochlorococcus sp. MIT 1307]